MAVSFQPVDELIQRLLQQQKSSVAATHARHGSRPDHASISAQAYSRQTQSLPPTQAYLHANQGVNELEMHLLNLYRSNDMRGGQG